MIDRAGIGSGPVSKGEILAVAAVLAATAIAAQSMGRAGKPAGAAAPAVEASPEAERPPNTSISIMVTPCSAHPAPAAVEATDPPASPGKVDNTSPWTHFWIGVALSVPVIAIAIWLFVAYPAGPDNAWLLVRYAAFMVVPGISLAVLGLYIWQQKKKHQLVMYSLNRHDYLTMAVQFLPGTLIAVLGNLLPTEPMLFGWITISWASIVLGTAVSVMVVRKFGKA